MNHWFVRAHSLIPCYVDLWISWQQLLTVLLQISSSHSTQCFFASLPRRLAGCPPQKRSRILQGEGISEDMDLSSYVEQNQRVRDLRLEVLLCDSSIFNLAVSLSSFSLYMGSLCTPHSGSNRSYSWLELPPWILPLMHKIEKTTYIHFILLLVYSFDVIILLTWSFASSLCLTLSSYFIIFQHHIISQ